MTTQSRRLRLSIAFVLIWLALAAAGPPAAAMACSYLGPGHLLFDPDLLAVLCAEESSLSLTQPSADNPAALTVLAEFDDPGLLFDLTVYVPADDGPRPLPTVAVREVWPNAECPLNGLRYPPEYRAAWEGRRPSRHHDRESSCCAAAIRACLGGRGLRGSRRGWDHALSGRVLLRPCHGGGPCRTGPQCSDVFPRLDIRVRPLPALRPCRSRLL